MNHIQMEGFDLRVSGYDDTIHYLTEHPRRRLIYFKDQSFILPFPWVHYLFVKYPGVMWLTGIFVSNQDLGDDARAAYMPLPNMNQGIPCNSKDFNRNSIQDQLISFWSGTFNNDGILNNLKFWRFLSEKAGATRQIKDRAKVLSYWETLTVKDVLQFRWPAHTLLD